MITKSLLSSTIMQNGFCDTMIDDFDNMRHFLLSRLASCNIVRFLHQHVFRCSERHLRRMLTYCQPSLQKSYAKHRKKRKEINLSQTLQFAFFVSISMQQEGVSLVLINLDISFAVKSGQLQSC